MQVHAIDDNTIQFLTPKGEIVLLTKPQVEMLVKYLTRWLQGGPSEAHLHPQK